MSVVAEISAPLTVAPFGSALSNHQGVTVEVDPVVPSGGSSHHLWIGGEASDALVEDLNSSPDFGPVVVVDELPDRTLVRVGWETADSPLFDLVDSVDGRISAAEGTPDGWSLCIRFPDREAVRRFISRAGDRNLGIELRELLDTPAVEDRHAVSPKQRETLAAALEMGYFEVPRQATLADFAAELDISEQGVSERLRRGLSTYLSLALHGDGTNGNNG